MYLLDARVNNKTNIPPTHRLPNKIECMQVIKGSSMTSSKIYVYAIITINAIITC